MLSSIDFNNFIFNVGLAISHVIIAIIFFLIIFRYWSISRNQKSILYQNAWNTAFKNIENGAPFSQPLIKNQKEYVSLIRFWLRRVESVNNQQQQTLLRFMKDLQPEKTLSEMLNHKNRNYQAVALKALKYLKYKQFEEKLHEILKDKNPFFSLLSAQVLIKIAPQNAIGGIVDFYLKKDDWVYKKICQILGEAEERHLSKILPNLIKTTPKKKISKLVKLLTIIDKQTAYDEAIKLITKYDNPKIIAASLKYINRKKDRDILLAYTKHQSQEVRLGAIKSLANIITPEDTSAIELLLSDKFWKVRQHTANTLISQSFVRAEYLDKLESSLVDENAIKSLAEARRIKSI